MKGSDCPAPRGRRFATCGSPRGRCATAPPWPQVCNLRIGQAASPPPRALQIGQAASPPPRALQIGQAASPPPRALQIRQAASPPPRDLRIGQAASPPPRRTLRGRAQASHPAETRKPHELSNRSPSARAGGTAGYLRVAPGLPAKFRAAVRPVPRGPAERFSKANDCSGFRGPGGRPGACEV
jgi:hypothetical protein